jgi:hypothetical protein
MEEEADVEGCEGLVQVLKRLVASCFVSVYHSPSSNTFLAHIIAVHYVRVLQVYANT